MFWQRLKFHLFKLFRPVMVGNYKRYDGVRLPHTRISNTTFFYNEENFHVADHVFIGHHNFIDASVGIVIEEGCHITNFVSILNHSSHIAIRLYGKFYDETPHKQGYNSGKVHIGAYTFIGPHTVIMPNTKLGKGCLISAYSYVKGNFPDFSVISGNPAVIIGDTRTLDEPYLEQNPQLKPMYDAWATSSY